MKFAKTALPLLLITLVAFFSCKNTNTEFDYNPNVLASKDYIFIEDSFMEAFNTYFKSVNDQAVMNGEQGWIDSAVVIYHQATNVLTFDYGDVNRECHDGKFRRGNVIVSFDDTPNVPGTIAQFSFDSLFVDDILQEGLIISEFLEEDQGSKRYGFVVSGGSMSIIDTSQTDTTRIGYNCNYVMKWEEGADTPGYLDDDLLTITGSCEGYSGKGVAFQGEITVPLNNYIMCNWLYSGILNLRVPVATVPESTVDYITEDQCNYRVNFYVENNLFYDYLK